MEWSNEYTFKAEDKLDVDFGCVYHRLARHLNEDGTGVVSSFGTIEEETTSVVRIHSKVLLRAELDRSLRSVQF